MKQNKKIYLTGYFDSNFGDDIMMKLVVRQLPDITFVVDKNASSPILSEKNVVQESYEEYNSLPKLVVIGSGFMINYKGALKSEIVSFLKGCNPGDYCLGCNIEPLDSILKRFLISKKMNKFKLITCRDWLSYSWLRKYTQKPNVHFLPDILFSLPDEWIPKVSSPSKLGISLMHRAGDMENCTYYRAMAEAADEWIKETGKQVVLMAFDSGLEDDVFACQAVKSLMKFSNQVEIVAHSDGTEIFEAYAQCEKIIGARFHSIVLALRMGIPCYPVIYREKARNLLKDLKYSYFISDIDNIDRSSLNAFIVGNQEPYFLDDNIFMRANEHTQLLREQLLL